MSIEQFLEGLARGEKDSEGRFTISREQAKEKLRRFQLVDPHHYVLNVVAAASASQAERLEVRTDADDCVMTLRGGRVPRLEELLASLLSSHQSADPYLRELARAVYGSLGLRSARIRVTTWDGQRGEELTLSGDHTETIRPLAKAPWEGAGLRVHVHEGLSRQVVGRFLGRLAGAGTPAGDLLEARCSYAPLPISLNGKNLNRPYELGSCDHVVHLDGGHGLPAVWKGSPVQHRRVSEGFSAWLGVASEAQWGKTLLVLVGGVSFPLEPRRVGHPGLRGVVLHDRLTKDLSQERLVEDEAFQGLVVALTKASRPPANPAVT